MMVENIVFLCVIGIGILAFTFMSFHWKGILFLPILAAIFWLLFGLWAIQSPEQSFMFKRELGVLFIGIAIAMFFAPFWIRAKDADLEKAPPDDIDIWAGMADEHRARVDKHKNLKRRRK